MPVLPNRDHQPSTLFKEHKLFNPYTGRTICRQFTYTNSNINTIGVTELKELGLTLAHTSSVKLVNDVNGEKKTALVYKLKICYRGRWITLQFVVHDHFGCTIGKNQQQID